jgi:hypothetical protein
MIAMKTKSAATKQPKKMMLQTAPTSAVTPVTESVREEQQAATAETAVTNMGASHLMPPPTHEDPEDGSSVMPKALTKKQGRRDNVETEGPPMMKSQTVNKWELLPAHGQSQW